MVSQPSSQREVLSHKGNGIFVLIVRSQTSNNSEKDRTSEASSHTCIIDQCDHLRLVSAAIIGCCSRRRKRSS